MVVWSALDVLRERHLAAGSLRRHAKEVRSGWTNAANAGVDLPNKT